MNKLVQKLCAFTICTATKILVRFWRWTIPREHKFPLNIIGFDFDGVINPYTSGWNGVGNYLPPDPDMVTLIRELSNHGFKIAIISARLIDDSEHCCMSDYMKKHGIPYDYLTFVKLPCEILIDDKVGYFKHGMSIQLLRDKLTERLSLSERTDIACSLYGSIEGGQT